MQDEMELVRLQRGQRSEATRGQAEEDGCSRGWALCLFCYVCLANSAESSLLRWHGLRVSGVATRLYQHTFSKNF